MEPRSKQSARFRFRPWIAALVTGALILGATPVGATRLKDVVSFFGVRSNQLIGYGLVVGLNNTGDDQQSYFMLRSVQLMLRRLGIQAAMDDKYGLQNLRMRNSAAVMVTADLPPFARPGSRVDIVVSSIGNARSLQGGTLLLTPLRGVDLRVYALAQGPISIGGAYSVVGFTGTQLQKNHTNVGRIPSGAIVEREVSSRFVKDKKMTLMLGQPDFTTAERIAAAINKQFGGKAAAAVDSASVVVNVPDKYKDNAVELASQLEVIQVEPDAPAQVIINERTGTVVIGQNVELRPVAISHGPLTLEISERFGVSQPMAPFSNAGKTEVVQSSQTTANEQKAPIQMVSAATNLADVVKALNALGAAPRDLIAIFQALEQSGALPAKLVVQ